MMTIGAIFNFLLEKQLDILEGGKTIEGVELVYGIAVIGARSLRDCEILDSADNLSDESVDGKANAKDVKNETL